MILLVQKIIANCVFNCLVLLRQNLVGNYVVFVYFVIVVA